jgi:hypothetical protein
MISFGPDMLINQILVLDGGIFESELPLSPPQSRKRQTQGETRAK